MTIPLINNLRITANNLNLQCFEVLVRVNAKLFLWDHQISIHPCDSKDIRHKCVELQVYSSVRVDVSKFQPVIVKVCWLCRCLLECFPDRLRDTHPWPDFLLICLSASRFWSRTLSKSFPVVAIFGVGHFKNHSLVISPIVFCRWRTWRAVTQNHPWDHVWEVSLTQLLYTTTIVYLSLACFVYL